MKSIQKVSSRDNQKLKFARGVREGRETTKVFVEGLRLCEELLKSDHGVDLVCFTEKFLQSVRGNRVIELLSERNAELLEVADRIFETLSDTKTSQGIIVIAEKPVTGKEIVEKNLSRYPLLLLLHQINNPANLGAILRTAEAGGIHAVVTTKGTADAFSTKAIRSALGANLRVPLWVNAEYAEVIAWAKGKNVKTVSADIRSEKSYLDINWTTGRMLVLGSEAAGLSDEERLLNDDSMIIPMESGVESLNVAVAAGIILFEAKRQRDK